MHMAGISRGLEGRNVERRTAFKANARDIASRNREPSNTLDSSRHD
jgi:hypothetical protein